MSTQPNFPDFLLKIGVKIIIIEGLSETEMRTLQERSYEFLKIFEMNLKSEYYVFLEEVRDVMFYEVAKRKGDRKILALKQPVGEGYNLIEMK